MGITIHYEGRLRSEEALADVVALTRRWALEAGRTFREVAEADGVLERMIDEEERDYCGRVRGIIVQPHPDSEPLHLLFGDDLVVQDFCKTQFSNTETHVAITELFNALVPCFDDLTVYDEGEYWETRDLSRLQELWEAFEAALSNLLAEHPDAEVNVRLPRGRVIDALT